MATKAEMAAELKALGGDDLDPEKTTIKELSEKIENQKLKNDRAENEKKLKEQARPEDQERAAALAKEDAAARIAARGSEALEKLAAPGGVTRRKVNRGSTRRITRAMEAFRKACEDFAAEIDTQVYITDEETGQRVGTWNFVNMVLDLPKRAEQAISEVTAPALPNEVDQEDGEKQ